MEHHKSTEVTHRVVLKANDIISLLNRPPRAVLVPPAAEVQMIPDGAEPQVIVRWVEKDK